MAVNLSPPESLSNVSGVRLSSVEAGIRYKNRDDLVLMELAPGSHVAGVFTTNAFCAAPVTLCRQHLAETSPRYFLINAGNANAGMGETGMQAAEQTCQMVADLTGCKPDEVLPFSTGVIGEQLNVDAFEKALPESLKALDENGWYAAANAIMTTDTVAKAVSIQLEIESSTVTITGMAKGSGMIEPNMATMLAYVATDAAIETEDLQHILETAVADSFNAITVDGDTSTNDSLVLAATGQSGVTVSADNRYFQLAVNEVCQFLAQAIIRDAEGATKFVTIDVNDAFSTAEARAVGYTIARSPLVKTALFASDPNWGRILAAIGRSPIENLDINKITIWLGDTLLLESGQLANSYTEEQGQAEMDKDEITIRVYLGRGEAIARIWTSDLSHDYVKINAEYRS
jgi:glutamate N-acetyltransferase/amino-acid N-acetyltransferase